MGRSILFEKNLRIQFDKVLNSESNDGILNSLAPFGGELSRFENFKFVQHLQPTQNSISFHFYIHFITIKSTTYAKFGKTAKIFRPLYFDKIFCEKRRNLHWKKFSCLYNNLEIFVIKPRGSLMILNIGQKRTFRECRVNFSNFLTNRRTKL